VICNEYIFRCHPIGILVDTGSCHLGYKNEGVTVIAHNFKGYDSLPILGYLYQNGVKPTIIANGAKNMYIEVPGSRIRMIDSILCLICPRRSDSNLIVLFENRIVVCSWSHTTRRRLFCLKYLSTTEGVCIQHARNGGEKEIGPYKVDGYYENENGQKYVLEFNGKFWHGCLHCYNASIESISGF
jgi:hypothetical protein